MTEFVKNSENIQFEICNAPVSTIAAHLWDCDKDFEPPLSQRTDIDKYALKIHTNAITFEAWNNSHLVGMVAAYFNPDKNKFVYITSVSVTKKMRGSGIAQCLLENCINKAKAEGYVGVELEVSHLNKMALGLYEKKGFRIISQSGKIARMLYSIKNIL